MRWLAALVACGVASSVVAVDSKELAQILKQLGDKKADKRIEASLRLVQLKAPEAVPALRAALGDSDETVRYNAAGALWNLGEAARPAAPELTKALDDKNAGVRLQAAGALIGLRLSPTETVAALNSVVRDGAADDDDRRRATDLLKRAGGTGGLQAAVRAGDLEAIRGTLDKGFPVDEADGQKRTALHWAASEGKADAAKLLIERGAKVSAADRELYQPLHLAASKGHLPVVELLLAHGADPGAQAKQHATPLQRAAFEGQTEVVLFFLAKGLDTPDEEGRRSVYFAAMGGRTELVKLLLDKKVEFQPASAFLRNQAGTPLHPAAMGGHLATMELLIARGVPLDAGQYGDTALHLAAQRGQLEAMKLLLAKGLKVDVVVPEYGGGRTALFSAVGDDQLAATQLLIEEGANVNAQESDGTTCLHLAMNRAGFRPGGKEIAVLLLDKGAHVNAKDSKGRTPLAIALESGHQAGAALLRQRGAIE